MHEESVEGGEKLISPPLLLSSDQKHSLTMLSDALLRSAALCLAAFVLLAGAAFSLLFAAFFLLLLPECRLVSALLPCLHF